MNRRLLVDLEALAANYRLFRSACADVRGADRAVGAVVKADGYGVGAERAVRRLKREGCCSFFVATLDEALALGALLDPVDELFVFEGVDARSAPDAAAAGIIPILNHLDQLEAWRPFAERATALHFDTGMSRLGFPVDTEPGLFASFNLSLLMTHLACADEVGHALNQVQVERFGALVEDFPGIRTSIGNSAGWLTGEPLRGDLGRPGIGLYGGNPFQGQASPVLPVAALQGRILQDKKLAAGESVGYGATCVLAQATRVGVVGVGYADGLPRQLSGRGALMVDGVRCPILGRISMDSTVIDLSRAPGARVGDWAECFGATMVVDEVAALAGTIAYDLLTGVGARVPRIEQSLT